MQNETIKSIAESLLGSNLIINKSQHGVEFKGKLYQFPPKIKDLINLNLFDYFKISNFLYLGKFHWFIEIGIKVKILMNLIHTNLEVSFFRRDSQTYE